LELALKDVHPIVDSRILVGNNNADDAGVLRVDESLALVTTVDVLAPVVDDPYDFGYIAATNCLSDIYAMGGDPLICLNVVGWPTAMNPEILGEIMIGSQDAVLESGAVVLGGHTFQSTEIRYGLSVTGRIDPGRIYTNSGARPGEDLILTKPLGAGTAIQCAVSRGAAPEDTYTAVLSSMKSSNGIAAGIMRRIGASACTDITGFGFLGHCWEMASGSGVGIDIRASALPTFPHVRGLIGEGIIDGSNKMNRNSFARGVRFEVEDPVLKTLLYSAETSGGLLIAVDRGSSEAMLAALHEAGLTEAAIIGSVITEHPGVVVVAD
jgi:selenide, water dikinase